MTPLSGHPRGKERVPAEKLGPFSFRGCGSNENNCHHVDYFVDQLD